MLATETKDKIKTLRDSLYKHVRKYFCQKAYGVKTKAGDYYEAQFTENLNIIKLIYIFKP